MHGKACSFESSIENCYGMKGNVWITSSQQLLWMDGTHSWQRGHKDIPNKILNTTAMTWWLNIVAASMNNRSMCRKHYLVIMASTVSDSKHFWVVISLGFLARVILSAVKKQSTIWLIHYVHVPDSWWSGTAGKSIQNNPPLTFLR